jgi:hypothetical protein
MEGVMRMPSEMRAAAQLDGGEERKKESEQVKQGRK